MEAYISIPVQGTNEEVLVSTSELPAEPEDLLELLKGEIAPLTIWLDFAKAYLAAGRVGTMPCPSMSSYSASANMLEKLLRVQGVRADQAQFRHYITY